MYQGGRRVPEDSGWAPGARAMRFHPDLSLCSEDWVLCDSGPLTLSSRGHHYSKVNTIFPFKIGFFLPLTCLHVLSWNSLHLECLPTSALPVNVSTHTNSKSNSSSTYSCFFKWWKSSFLEDTVHFKEVEVGPSRRQSFLIIATDSFFLSLNSYDRFLPFHSAFKYTLGITRLNKPN